jgi:hypothetical protein
MVPVLPAVEQLVGCTDQLSIELLSTGFMQSIELASRLLHTTHGM